MSEKKEISQEIDTCNSKYNKQDSTYQCNKAFNNKNT